MSAAAVDILSERCTFCSSGIGLDAERGLFNEHAHDHAPHGFGSGQVDDRGAGPHQPVPHGQRKARPGCAGCRRSGLYLRARAVAADQHAVEGRRLVALAHERELLELAELVGGHLTGDTLDMARINLNAKPNVTVFFHFPYGSTEKLHDAELFVNVRHPSKGFLWEQRRRVVIACNYRLHRMAIATWQHGQRDMAQRVLAANKDKLDETDFMEAIEQGNTDHANRLLKGATQ